MVKLGSVTTKVGSGATPRGGKVSYKSAGISLIRSQNVHFDGFRDEGLAFLDDDQAEALKSVEVRADDVLLNITGASIGRVTTAPYRMSGARVNQHVCIIRPKPELSPSYLRWYLASPHVQHFIFDIQTGVTRQALTKDQILAFSVPLPPLEIQERVVSEIEKQFSRLDEAVSALKRIQANLKRYKAAVLKAAVEGKLTEQWRKGHPDVEPADQLLKHILAERRAKWEAEELAKMKAKGIKPKDDSWKKKYKEPAGPDTANLPELPEGWVWVRLGALPVDVFDGPFGSNLKSTDYVSSGVRVIRLENIGSLEFIDGKVSFVTEQKYEQLKKHTVGHGDIIFSSFVANETRVVILPGHIKKAINKADCFCVRINDVAINKRYIETFLATRTAYEQLVGDVHGATRPRINTTQLKDCHISMPSIAEQNEIVSEIDRRLSVTEELETTIETNLKRAERLRQTILSKQFHITK
nr:restriction endonuclease subunit S [Geoanaerobacter pelophilus]